MCGSIEKIDTINYCSATFIITFRLTVLDGTLLRNNQLVKIVMNENSVEGTTDDNGYLEINITGSPFDNATIYCGSIEKIVEINSNNIHEMTL